MAKDRNQPEEDFEAILSWLDSDREKAGHKYEELRRSLIRILGWQSCVDAEGLADEVFRRVGCKVHELKETYKGDPRLYFYAVANNLAKEHQKQSKWQVGLDEVDLSSTPAPEEEIEDPQKARTLECFSKCLQELSAENRELIVAYYQDEKQVKISNRKALAARLGIEVNALRVRMHRIRVTLEECVEKCLKDTGE